MSRLEASKNRDRTLILDLPNPQKSSFGGVSEACLRVLGCLGQSWCVLGVSGMRLACVLERLGGVLGPSWSVLGGSWRGFGESWRLLGSFLGVFSEVFMPS